MVLSQIPVLSRVGHDRAAERRTDEGWLAAAWERGLALVVTPEYTTAVVEQAAGAALALRPCSSVPAGAERYFLGLAGDDPVFAARGPRDLVGDRWVDLREIGAALNDRDAGLLTTAVALARWHDRHPRCPIDGTPTALVNGGWVRRCPTDGSEHFPRTDPAVIMLVHDGADRCVLGRQAVWPEGRFSILAGFVEPGESAEAAVAREVDEEVGLADHRRDVRGIPAVAVPVVADARLHGAGDRVGAEPAGRRAGRGALVHPGRGQGPCGAAATAGVDRAPAHHRLGRAGVTPWLHPCAGPVGVSS